MVNSQMRNRQGCVEENGKKQNQGPGWGPSKQSARCAAAGKWHPEQQNDRWD